MGKGRTVTVRLVRAGTSSISTSSPSCEPSSVVSALNSTLLSTTNWSWGEAGVSSCCDFARRECGVGVSGMGAAWRSAHDLVFLGRDCGDG